MDAVIWLTWRILSENGLIISRFSQVDLFHAIQRLHEGPPELMPAMLTIRKTVDAAFLLQLHDFLDGFLLDGHQGVCDFRSIGDCVAVLHEMVRSQEGADVLCSEGRTAWCGGHF